jgi:Protein of unknown function (DUF1573)
MTQGMGKHSLVCCIAVALLCACSTEETPTSAKKGPQIVVSKNTASFGKIRQGQFAEHVFILPNKGNKDLHIININGPHSCKTDFLTDMTVKPGAEFKFKVSCNTIGRSGAVEKRFTVISDDSNKRDLELVLKGEILVSITATPRVVSFGQLMGGGNASKELLLTLSDPEKEQIYSIVSENELFTVEKLDGDSAAESRYLVGFKGTKTPGRLMTNLVVHLASDTKSPAIKVPIRVTVLGQLRYSRNIFLGRKNGKIAPRDIVISARSGKPIKITKIEAPKEDLKLEKIEGQGNRVILRASVFDSSKSFTPSHKGVITIGIDGSEESSVTIEYIISDQPKLQQQRSSARRGFRSMAPLLK